MSINEGGIGDIAGRMRKWEPSHFGPINKESFDYETWSSLENSEPTLFKKGKKVSYKNCPLKKKVLNKGKLGLFAGLLTIAIGATIGSKSNILA
jgi:hypothetical protein